jgi:hypothetical protein
MKDATTGRFTRPRLKRHGPNRSAVNFYRAAVDDPRAIGGVALDSVESAATAAVRLGYRVAEAQVERSRRLAQRFRAAGDAATGGHSDRKRSDRKALDATEQLIFKTLMAGLGWLEGAAAERNHPMRRLMTAQFQLLGALLGIVPPDMFSRVRDDGAFGGEAPARERGERDAAVRTGAQRRRALQIRHSIARGHIPRAVRIVDWEIAADVSAGRYPVIFYGLEGNSLQFGGEVEIAGRAMTVHLSIPPENPPGLYKAAVCRSDGLQVGYLELSV